jgi:hypothetical protein
MVPGPASDTFAADWVEQHIVSEATCAEWGVTLDRIPLYVSTDRDGHRVTLRGHDRGEQALVADVAAALAAQDAPVDVVIVAGGSFDLRSPQSSDGEWTEDFLTRKRDYYRTLPLHPAVERAASEVAEAQANGFIGLHLRYSDRSHQAPRTSSIEAALAKQAAESGLTSVFIASDTSSAREEWTQRAITMGLRPWDLTSRFAGLALETSAGPALADWRTLGRSDRLVYFVESSYAVEACVSSGSWRQSSALATSRGRAAAQRALTWGRAGLSYPARHWFSG